MSTTTTSTTTVTDTPAGLPPEAIIVAIALVAVLIVLLLLARRRGAPRTETQVQEPVAQERVVEAPPVVPPAAPVPVPLAPEAASVVVAAPPIAVEAASLPEPTPLAPAEADDFTRMKGVGPKLAAQLAGLGYTRFDQIASLTPEQADALDAQLGNFRGRLARDRWIEQAGYLAKGDTAGFEAAFGRL